MYNELFGSDPYFVLVNVSFDIDDRRDRVVTSFNKQQARVGQDILNQPHERRSQWGMELLNLIKHLRDTRELRYNTYISATLWNGQFVERMPVNLHWRCMRMLALACVTNQEPLIKRLSECLRDIEMGVYENKSVINPFEFLEQKKLIT